MEKILALVQERLADKAVDPSHHALLLENAHIHNPLLPELEEKMSAEGFSITRKESCESADARQAAKNFGLLVVENLTLQELWELRDLRPVNDTQKLIYSFLQCGKRVYALSEDVTFSGCNPVLEHRLEVLAGELQALGLQLVCRGAPSAVHLNQLQIQAADIRNIRSGALIVPQGAVFTTAARRCLEERGVVIVRG